MTTDALPEDDNLFDLHVSESASLCDRWIGSSWYRAVFVTEVRDGDKVLPVGWGSSFTALGSCTKSSNPEDNGAPVFSDVAAERLDDDHIQIRTNDGPDWAIIFDVREKVLVTT